LKHKVSIISLIICLVAPLLATYIYLQFEKVAIRREIKHQIIAGIDKNELVQLKFSLEESANQLEWEHSKEFEYRGQMYDVVESIIHSDSIYYWCWMDNKETALHKKLDQLLGIALGNSPSKKDKEDKLLEFYKNLYCQSMSYIDTPASVNKKKQIYFCENYNSVQFKPPVPPPLHIV
jgi:hypothetical protein